jgi:hypothetical protein
MTRHWHFLGRHPQMLLTVIVLLALSLVGCAAFEPKGATTGSTPGAITPSVHEIGHVIVQLFSSPGFIYPPINGIPDWTLYSSGTLIYKSATGNELLQAQLSPAEVQQILDVIVNQIAFFSSTRNFYGRMIPDTGSLLLRVSANGQYKEVRLFVEPTSSPDQQTQHVFAIKHFLLNYHPATTQPYTPSGVALLVIPQQRYSHKSSTWPYNDISLGQVAAQECLYLRFGPNSACSPLTGSKSGLFPVYGKRGQELLQQWQSGSYTFVSQNNLSYQIFVWALLPDVLSPQAGGSQGVLVQGEGAGIWPLLSGSSS